MQQPNHLRQELQQLRHRLVLQADLVHGGHAILQLHLRRGTQRGEAALSTGRLPLGPLRAPHPAQVTRQAQAARTCSSLAASSGAPATSDPRPSACGLPGWEKLAALAAGDLTELLVLLNACLILLAILAIVDLGLLGSK